MRNFISVSVAVVLVFGPAALARAQQEPRAIIDKAIKAHGGEEKLSKVKAVRAKAKGRVEVLGGFDFTSEGSANLSGPMKEVVEGELNGQKFTAVNVYDGKKAWASANGMTIELDENLLQGMKEMAYLMRLSLLVCLKDKEFELSPLGEVRVNDRAALGVKVSCKGHKDANLYFDKETSLLVKDEHRAMDFMTGQEVAEENLYLEYKDVDGIQVVKKLVSNRDAKKYMEAELTEVKYLDQAIDEGEFVKP